MNAGVLVGARRRPGTGFVLASAVTYTVVGDLRVFIDAYATGADAALGTGALWALKGRLVRGDAIRRVLRPALIVSVTIPKDTAASRTRAP